MRQIIRLIAKGAHHRRIFLSPPARASLMSIPDNDLSYTGNFLNMLDRMAQIKYHAQPGPGTGTGCAVHSACRP